MEDKQKNDSKGDSPTRDAVGCAFAGLFILLLLCVLGGILGHATAGHNPLIMSICAAAVIVFCAAVGVCLSREQKGGQNENQSESASLLKLLFGFAVAVGLFFLIVVLFLVISFIINCHV